jgi:hypothetical protein
LFSFFSLWFVNMWIQTHPSMHFSILAPCCPK